MRFLLMIKPGSENSVTPTPALMQAVGELTQKMIERGVLVDTGGMQDSKSAIQLKLAKGKVTGHDGPFTESNEIVGGYAIVDVKSREEAVAMAKEFLDLHARVMGPEFSMESEVRRMYLPSDF